MYTCKICNKEFEKRHSYIGHCSVHNRNEQYKVGRKKTESVNKELKCKYCNKEFSLGKSLAGHQTWCKQNPNTESSKAKISKIRKDISLSEEHKQKISVSRKRYLDENPGNIPYLLNHSSKESYPEKIFREALETNKISGWVQEYPIKRYSLDFAFVDLKINIEIDGATHSQDFVRIKDEERDNTLQSLGWIVYRINAKDLLKDLNTVITKVIDLVA